VQGGSQYLDHSDKATLFMHQNKTSGKIVSSGEKRTYLLYVPSTYNPDNLTPLVITLHGFTDWPAHIMKVSRWNDLAEEQGFLVVYPAGRGLPRRWRASDQSGAKREIRKDVTFISDLIDQLQSEFTIDPDRIYANGLSNGGGMSFALACRLADRIAAIGSVAGAHVLPWAECNPGRPVPVIAFHGDADRIVPYSGGPSSRFYNGFPPVSDWVATWAGHNGCDRSPLNLQVSEDVSAILYTSCDQNAQVVLYTIRGGGHAWPGGMAMAEWIVGKTTQDIDATRTMWDFFRQHPMKRQAP
jgi:polyhydroxybutyrate depolymerase